MIANRASSLQKANGRAGSFYVAAAAARCLTLLQEAPEEVQKKANCIIGKDYPAPIVNHKEISKTNIGRMKEAYDKNKAMKSPAKKPAASSPDTKKSPKKQKTNAVP